VVRAGRARQQRESGGDHWYCQQNENWNVADGIEAAKAVRREV